MTETELKNLYKVIATDFKIVTRKTGLWTLEYCESMLNDIKVLLINGYLERISLILHKSNSVFNVIQYNIASVNREINDRPGNNDWEEGDGISLQVVLNHTPLWNNLPDDEKSQFEKDNFKLSWSQTNINTDFNGMHKNITKKFTQGNTGIDRLDIS